MSARPRTRRRRIGPGQVAAAVVLMVASAAVIAPFLWVLRGAFAATDAQLYQLPPSLLLDDATLGNFPDVFRSVPFARFLVNSLVIAGTITVAQLVTCSTAAYAFARLEFRGKRIIFALMLASLMIPVQITMVPLFLLMREIGLYNTHWALILPPSVNAFGVFLLRQHFLTVPRELEEAAEVDGAGRFTRFARIILPLSGPALATLAILAFTFWWNDLLMPLIMLSDVEKQTLPVGLVVLAGRFSSGSLGTIAAGITLAVLPVLVLFIVAQRFIVQSIASSGLKV